MTIFIPTTLDEIDEELSCSGMGSEQAKPLEISLSDLRSAQEKPMVESALIQWVISKWRNTSSGALSLLDGDLEKFAALAPGAALALLPYGKVHYLAQSRKKSADFREKYLSGQKTWPDLAVSNTSLLCCLDAFPGNFPPRLYVQDEPPKLTDPYGFKSLFEAMVASVASEHQLKTSAMLMSESVGSILYELFKNTHDHARESLKKEKLGDSLRGIYMRFYPVQNFDWLDNQTNEQQMSRNILETELATSVKTHFRGDAWGKKSNLSGFLELSVFDSGPGIAAKWMDANPECESSYDAVLACFRKGATTTTNGARGYGLFKVWTLLNQLKGSIRVRTNGVHLFRGFSLAGGVGVISKDGEPDMAEFKLFDWKKGLTPDKAGAYSKYSEVEGTLVSVMLPMEAV
ncbi:MAG: hypothetical protein ABL877_11860 [Thiobacillus sp.]